MADGVGPRITRRESFSGGLHSTALTGPQQRERVLSHFRALSPIPLGAAKTLSIVKTSCNRRINNLAKGSVAEVRVIFLP